MVETPPVLEGFPQPGGIPEGADELEIGSEKLGLKETNDGAQQPGVPVKTFLECPPLVFRGRAVEFFAKQRSKLRPGHGEILTSSHRLSTPFLTSGSEPRVEAGPSRGLVPHAGQLLVGGDVDDLELLGMQGRIRTEGELPEVAFLDLDEVFFVLGAQTVKDGRMDDDAELEI